ncbi:MAG: hypothetical protein AB1782_10550 [Cyanobacteriota bacterium]
MSVTLTQEIKDFLSRISTIYSVSLWNPETLSRHFDLEDRYFILSKDRSFIRIPYYIDNQDIKASILAGTFFFIKNKRMVRGLPFAYEINKDDKSRQSLNASIIEKVFLENPGVPYEKELKLDSINLRLFKLGKSICCATRFEPLIIPSQFPKVSFEALEYLYKYYYKAFDILQDGYVLYFDYLDPAYSDTMAKTVYLRAISTSRGEFLSIKKLKEVSYLTKLPIIKEFSANSRIPGSYKAWEDDYNQYKLNLQEVNKDGLYIKAPLSITGNNYDQIYLLIKNPDIVNIHKLTKNKDTLLKRIKLKLQIQLPENVSGEEFDRLLKYEILNDYSLKTYEALVKPSEIKSEI